MRYARSAVFGCVLFALVSGCGKRPAASVVPVTGIIRLEGKPLKKVLVRFIHASAQGRGSIAMGVTDETGRYTLTYKGQPGACVGENHVLVSEAELPSLPLDEHGHPKTGPYFESLGGRPLPEQYTRLVESPLTVNVRADRTEYDFDLTR
jgi:hypothetical protein